LSVTQAEIGILFNSSHPVVLYQYSTLLSVNKHNKYHKIWKCLFVNRATCFGYFL